MPHERASTDSISRQTHAILTVSFSIYSQYERCRVRLDRSSRVFIVLKRIFVYFHFYANWNCRVFFVHLTNIEYVSSFSNILSSFLANESRIIDLREQFSRIKSEQEWKELCFWNCAPPKFQNRNVHLNYWACEVIEQKLSKSAIRNIVQTRKKSVCMLLKNSTRNRYLITEDIVENIRNQNRLW